MAYVKEKVRVRSLSGYEGLGESDYTGDLTSSISGSSSGATIKDAIALRAATVSTATEKVDKAVFDTIAQAHQKKAAADISKLAKTYGTSIGEALVGSVLPTEVIQGMKYAVSEAGTAEFTALAKSLEGGLTPAHVQGAFEFTYAQLRSQDSLLNTLIARNPAAAAKVQTLLTVTKTAATVIEAAAYLGNIAVDAATLGRQIQAKGGVDASGVASAAGLVQRAFATAQAIVYASGDEDAAAIMDDIMLWAGVATGCAISIATGAAAAGYGAVVGAAACLGQVLVAALTTAFKAAGGDAVLNPADGPWVVNNLSISMSSSLSKSRLGLAAMDATRLADLLKSRYGVASYKSMLKRAQWYSWLSRTRSDSAGTMTWPTIGDRSTTGTPAHTPLTVLAMMCLCPPSHQQSDWSNVANSVAEALETTSLPNGVTDLPFYTILDDITVPSSAAGQLANPPWWKTQCPDASLTTDYVGYVYSGKRYKILASNSNCHNRSMEHFAYHDINQSTIFAMASLAKVFGKKLYSNMPLVLNYLKVDVPKGAGRMATDDNAATGSALPIYYAAYLHVSELIDYFAAMTKFELETTAGREILKPYLQSVLPINFRVTTESSDGDNKSITDLVKTSGIQWYAQTCWSNLYRCGLTCDLNSLYNAMTSSDTTTQECALREFGWIRLLAAFSYMHATSMGDALDSSSKLFEGVDMIEQAPTLNPTKYRADLASLPIDPRPSLSNGKWVTPGITALYKKIKNRDKLYAAVKVLVAETAAEHSAALEKQLAQYAEVNVVYGTLLKAGGQTKKTAYAVTNTAEDLLNATKLAAYKALCAKQKVTTTTSKALSGFGATEVLATAKRATVTPTAAAALVASASQYNLVGFLPVDTLRGASFNGFEGFDADLILATKSAKALQALPQVMAKMSTSGFDLATSTVDWNKVDFTKEPWKSINWKKLHIGCCPGLTRAACKSACGTKCVAACTSSDSIIVPYEFLIKAVKAQQARINQTALLIAGIGTALLYLKLR